MRLWQTPRLLGHVDTELPEFVFETSFKIVPSNPSSEVAPCFELEPVYEISWQHGWWYIDFDIVFINQRAKNLAENRLMWTILITQGCFVEHHIVYLRGQKYRVRYLPQRFLSLSGDLGIGLVWDNHIHRTGPPTFWSDCWNPLQTELNHLWWVLSCS